jgi:hypothetical protein
MKKSTSHLALFIGVFFMGSLYLTAQNNYEEYDLRMKFGNVNAIENLNEYVAAFNIDEQQLVNGKYYKIIQFFSLPSNSEKESLESLGIEFLGYIPNRAYIAAIPGTFELGTLAGYDVRSIVDIIPEFKQAPSILDQEYPEYALFEDGQIGLVLSYFDNIPFNACVAELDPYTRETIQSNPMGGYQIVKVDIADLGSISSSPYVKYVDVHFPDGEPENYTGKTLHRSNILDSDYATGRHYDGEGVMVMLQDDGIIGPHIDYQGRIGSQNLTSNWGNHGDHCAGTIFGAGNLDPTTGGMAPGAELHTWAASQENYPGFASIPDVYPSGIRISSTSYSNGCNDGYTQLAQTLDVQSLTYESLLHVFSAGNAGGDNCGYGAGNGWGNITGGHKAGKNVITTGSLNYTGLVDGYSSRGPAADGRIKPDISAKGSNVYSTVDPNTYQTKSGTSMACPGIAGSLAQLYQAYRELNSDEDPKGGLMKGLILNTATDMGNIGPDYKYGWGHVNLLRAVEVLEEERYMTGSVSQDEDSSHDITVPEGVKEMKVMVYWADKEGSLFASPALVNNLDITMTDPSANEHLPWLLSYYPDADSLDMPAVKGVDMVNNMEQVQINDPEAGTYSLNVAGTEVPFGPQEYYVIYDFIFDDVELTYPVGGESFTPGEDVTVRWDAWGDEEDFTLEYTIDDGTTWTTVSSSISGSLRYYDMNTPNDITGSAWVRISRGDLNDMGEESFSIMNIPGGIDVEKACPSSVLLSWNEVDGAESYDVFVLGEKYMDYAGSSTADTLWVEGVNSLDDQWFAVRAVGPGNAYSPRSNAYFKQAGMWECTVTHDLMLGDVLSPPMGILFDCQDYADVPVQLEIINKGIEPMGDFTLNYIFENGATVSESYNGTLEPGESMIHTFASTVSLPDVGTYSIEAWIEAEEDQNSFNDMVDGYSEIKTSIYMQTSTLYDFDDISNCSFLPDCDATECDLDDQFFNFQNSENDDIDWRALSGITQTAGTGPIGDHTTGTTQGKFLYLEATDCIQKKAVMTTPCIPLVGMTNPGFTFWYNMNGEDMGSLHVDVVSDGMLHKDVTEPLVGDFGYGWNEGFADLTQFAGKEVSIRLRGFTGVGELSDLAIDDISIDEMTGIERTTEKPALRIFPNPSEGAYNLVFEQASQSPVSVRVIDLTGRTILKNNYDQVQQYQSYTIDISAFDKGVYYLIVESGDEQFKEKLLKY